jgi:WD40 repeat protein
MTSAFSVAFSPAADLLALGGPDGKVTVVALASRQVVFSSQGHKLTVSSLAFSRQGHLLTSGGWDSKIQIWSTAGWTLNGEFEFGRPQSPELSVLKYNVVNWVAFGPGDALLAVACVDGSIQVLRQDQNWELAWTALRMRECVNTLAFAHDGSALLAGSSMDAYIHVFDPTFRELVSLQPQPLGAKPRQITVLAVSPDGRLLATGNEPGDVGLWDLTQRRCLGQQKEHADRIRGIGFISDTPLIVSASEDGELILWQADVGGLAKIRTAQSAADVTGSAISQDGRMLALACQESPVELWDPEALERRSTLEI